MESASIQKNESETNLKCRKNLSLLVSQKRRSFFKTKTYFKQQNTLFFKQFFQL